MPEILDKILQGLELPDVFTPNTIPFWDDEYISQQMLLAHLDPEYEGASRKADFMQKSVRWLTEQAPVEKYPALLDLGCGPGLYAHPLAKRGYTVTGLDLSARSIQWAKDQAKRENLPITYRVQDYLSVTAQENYDAAILIYCDYGALSAPNRKKLLAFVYDSLHPGGIFILDVFSTKKLAAFEEVKYWQSCPKGGFWNKNPYLALQHNYKYPGRVSLEQTVVLTEDSVYTYYIWNQYFPLEKLAAEVQKAGFKLAQPFDDVAGTPYTGEGETLALVLRKP